MAGVGFDRFEDRHQVLFHRKTPENRRFLRQVTDAQAGPAIHWEIRDDVAVAAEPNGLTDESAAVDDSGFEDSTESAADSLDLANAESMPAEADSPLDTDYDNVWDNGNAPVLADAAPASYDSGSVVIGIQWRVGLGCWLRIAPWHCLNASI